MKKIGICAIKQQDNFVVKSFFTEKLRQDYQENCILNTIISDAQKNLKLQNNAVKSFGISTDLSGILEKCEKEQINMLYVVKKDVPCLLNALHGDIEVKFI